MSSPLGLGRTTAPMAPVLRIINQYVFTDDPLAALVQGAQNSRTRIVIGIEIAVQESTVARIKATLQRLEVIALTNDLPACEVS